MGKKRWTCDACQDGRHGECEVEAINWQDDGGMRPICDCPCEPVPLPGWPGEQPAWPR